MLAEEPLRSALSELGRAKGFEPIECVTPLDTIQLLENLDDRIALAIISTEPSWARGMGELLAEEYPEVRQITLAA